MGYDFLTFPAILWSAFSAVIMYRRHVGLRGGGSDEGFGPFDLPEKVFVMCTLMMLLEVVLDHMPKKLFRGVKSTQSEELSEQEGGNGCQDRRRPEELQEPLRGGSPDSAETTGGKDEGPTKQEPGAEDQKVAKGSGGEAVLLMVRWQGRVTEYSVSDVRERIKLRSPLSVLHAGPDSQHMHIEELVTTYRKSQRQRNSVFVVDEFDNLVPLGLVLDKWNEVSKLLRLLEHDEQGELKYDVISSKGLAYLYFKDADIPPLKRSLDYVMSLVTLSRLLKDGFKVIDEGGTKVMTLEDMNELFERSEIYVSTGNCWIPLTSERVETFMTQYPQVFWSDKWWLATPAILDWVVSDPTVQSEFDLKAAIEKCKQQIGSHVGEPVRKAVPFPKASASPKNTAGAGMPPPKEETTPVADGANAK